jgi:hypothetical protein
MCSLTGAKAPRVVFPPCSEELSITHKYVEVLRELALEGQL